MSRACPSCGKAVVGHPNKRFCRPVCKDRYHNAQPHRMERTRQFNPNATRREHPGWSDPNYTDENGHTGSWAAYLAEVHPFSDEAF